MKSTHSLSWPVAFVFYQRPHINRNQLIDLVNSSLQHLLRMRRDMYVQRWILLCRFTPIWIPHALRAHRRSRLFMNLCCH